jgi:hypothetical protein
LGIGSPSGPSATAELRFTPFFFTPSVGGGIDEGTGVPLAAGVLEADSAAFSPFELAATGRVFEVADDESFEGDSSLIGTGANFLKASGDSFNLTIKEVFVDFRRAGVGVAEGVLYVEAIVRYCDGDDECEEGDRRSQAYY